MMCAAPGAAGAIVVGEAERGGLQIGDQRRIVDQRLVEAGGEEGADGHRRCLGDVGRRGEMGYGRPISLEEFA